MAALDRILEATPGARAARTTRGATKLGLAQRKRHTSPAVLGPGLQPEFARRASEAVLCWRATLKRGQSPTLGVALRPLHRRCFRHVGASAARRKTHVRSSKLAARAWRRPFLAGTLQGLLRVRAVRHVCQLRRWLGPRLTCWALVWRVAVTPGWACFVALRATAGYNHDWWFRCVSACTRGLAPFHFLHRVVLTVRLFLLWWNAPLAASLSHLGLVLASAATRASSAPAIPTAVIALGSTRPTGIHPEFACWARLTSCLPGLRLERSSTAGRAARTIEVTLVLPRRTLSACALREEARPLRASCSIVTAVDYVRIERCLA